MKTPKAFQFFLWLLKTQIRKVFEIEGLVLDLYKQTGDRPAHRHFFIADLSSGTSETSIKDKKRGVKKIPHEFNTSTLLWCRS